MKELKSKKTGRTFIYSEEEYKQIVEKPELLKKFTVTDLQAKVVPPRIIPPLEIKKRKKNEG
jgi:hypothetical protein